MSLFHELVLFWESETVNAEKSPSENEVGGVYVLDMLMCISKRGIIMNAIVNINIINIKVRKNA